MHRLDRRPPDHQRRQVPVAVDLQRAGVRAEAAGENDFDRALRIADHVPIGDHQAKLLADVDERAAAIGGRALFGHDDPRYCRMGRAGNGWCGAAIEERSPAAEARRAKRAMSLAPVRRRWAPWERRALGMAVGPATASGPDAIHKLAITHHAAAMCRERLAGAVSMRAIPLVGDYHAEQTLANFAELLVARTRSDTGGNDSRASRRGTARSAAAIRSRGFSNLGMVRIMAACSTSFHGETPRHVVCLRPAVCWIRLKPRSVVRLSNPRRGVGSRGRRCIGL